MQAEFLKIAEYMGKLCGSARYDWGSANPEDVGLNGMPVAGWGAAYFEGCQDMAQGIANLLPETDRAAVTVIARAAFDKAFYEAKAADAGRAHTEPPSLP